MPQPSIIHNKIEHHTAPWIRVLARFGYATKGLVYIVLGILAVQAAFNIGGETTGSEGALQAIAAQPFGRGLLFFVGIGLMGYILWRLVQAIRDPEHESKDWSDVVRRLSYAFSGLVYSGLALSAFRLALGMLQSSDADSNSAEAIAAKLLLQPMGRWLVGTVGAFVIGLSFYYFYRAFKAKFRGRLQLNEMHPDAKNSLIRLCQFGIAARGFVFSLIGGFLIQSAISADSSQAGSTEEALEAIEYSPFGRWTLTVVAFGFIAYGLYMVIQARYRKIDVLSNDS